MRGRKPDKLSVLRGARPGGGRQKHVHALEPLCAAPAHLAGEPREIFELVRTCAPPGLLSQVDRFLLEVLCQHVTLHRRAIRELEKLELTFEHESKLRAHPLVAIAGQQSRIVATLCQELGLSAPSRQRLRLPEPDAGAHWADIPQGKPPRATIPPGPGPSGAA
jgi:P27 family predicted phage terminase small subunit